MHPTGVKTDGHRGDVHLTQSSYRVCILNNTGRVQRVELETIGLHRECYACHVLLKKLWVFPVVRRAAARRQRSPRGSYVGRCDTSANITSISPLARVCGNSANCQRIPYPLSVSLFTSLRAELPTTPLHLR